MTIYKVVVWNCGEFEVWEEYNLTRFYSSKERAAERVRQLELLSDQIKECLMDREYSSVSTKYSLDMKNEDCLSFD